ncbi:hypothetical protein PAPYR_10753 [Paratrimastix pyriformis]|uniref:Uncharacterized protein n=1 Tax=Paratrimastix pyriformis TaxID=342808 RepID=A0ABQ8U5A2_9EUKA|nr:hypothetical protein PAPYR_10753 [Paratrimastix pyriformis]
MCFSGSVDYSLFGLLVEVCLSMSTMNGMETPSSPPNSPLCLPESVEAQMEVASEDDIQTRPPSAAPPQVVLKHFADGTVSCTEAARALETAALSVLPRMISSCQSTLTSVDTDAHPSKDSPIIDRAVALSQRPDGGQGALGGVQLPGAPDDLRAASAAPPARAAGEPAMTPWLLTLPLRPLPHPLVIPQLGRPADWTPPLSALGCPELRQLAAALRHEGWVEQPVVCTSKKDLIPALARLLADSPPEITMEMVLKWACPMVDDPNVRARLQELMATQAPGGAALISDPLRVTAPQRPEPDPLPAVPVPPVVPPKAVAAALPSVAPSPSPSTSAVRPVVSDPPPLAATAPPPAVLTMLSDASALPPAGTRFLVSSQGAEAQPSVAPAPRPQFAWVTYAVPAVDLPGPDGLPLVALTEDLRPAAAVRQLLLRVGQLLEAVGPHLRGTHDPLVFERIVAVTTEALSLSLKRGMIPESLLETLRSVLRLSWVPDLGDWQPQALVDRQPVDQQPPAPGDQHPPAPEDQKPPAPVAPSAPGSVPTVTVAALAPTARGRVGDLGTQQHAQQGPTQLQSVYLRRTPGTPWPEILGELPQKPMSIRYGPRKRYCYVELPVGAFEELRAAPPPGLFVGLATRRAANGKAPSQDREASPRERRSTAKEVVPVDDRTSPADDDEECLGRPRDSACACGEAQ